MSGNRSQASVSPSGPSVPVALGERHLFILKAVVLAHVETGLPVGSRTISRMPGIHLSAATIRNAMSDLEEMGLLSQPHASAGRMPTDLGFRYYVEALLERDPLPMGQRQLIQEACDRGGDDLELVLTEVSRLMAALTNCLGLALSPSLDQERFRQIRFLLVADKRVMAILLSESGRLWNRGFSLEEPLSQKELDAVAEVLAKRLSGLTLPEVRAALKDEVDKGWREYEILRVKLLTRVLVTSGHGSLIVNGQGNLFCFPELADSARARELLQTIEEKNRLVEILDRCLHASEVRLFLGTESPAVSGCALIAAKCLGPDGGPYGTLGVLGPTRLDYSQVIPLVDFTAQALSQRFLR